MTWADLASAAGLAPSTVYNLGNRVTRFPQLRTFYLLAQAVGMDLSLIRKEVRRYEAA
jgi:transcriptional regulator with XRE-family HTH domain